MQSRFFKCVRDPKDHLGPQNASAIKNKRFIFRFLNDSLGRKTFAPGQLKTPIFPNTLKRDNNSSFCYEKSGSNLKTYEVHLNAIEILKECYLTSTLSLKRTSPLSLCLSFVSFSLFSLFFIVFNFHYLSLSLSLT